MMYKDLNRTFTLCSSKTDVCETNKRRDNYKWSMREKNPHVLTNSTHFMDFYSSYGLTVMVFLWIINLDIRQCKFPHIDLDITLNYEILLQLVCATIYKDNILHLCTALNFIAS